MKMSTISALRKHLRTDSDYCYYYSECSRAVFFDTRRECEVIRMEIKQPNLLTSVKNGGIKPRSRGCQCHQIDCIFMNFKTHSHNTSP